MTTKRVNSSVRFYNPLESKQSLPDFYHQKMATINQTYVNFSNSIHITNINLINSSLNSDEFRVDDIYSNSGNVSDCNTALDLGVESSEYCYNGFQYNPLIHSATRNSELKKTISFKTATNLRSSASLDCFEEEDPDGPADVERHMGRVVEPPVVMSYLMQVQDPGNILIKVFIVLDRGFLSIFHDRLPDKNPTYPYGEALIKKMLLADCAVMSGQKNIAIVEDPTKKQQQQHNNNTRWIRADCPGLKAMIRPFPNFELPASSSIKDGEEVEIFLKPFSGYWCLRDGRGYFCCIVKGVKWIEIDAPSKLTMWFRLDCAPGVKVPVRSNPNIQDAPISFLTVGTEFGVYNRTESGFLKLVSGKGYVNKHTKNVTFTDINEPSSAAAMRHKKEIIEGSDLVFQPLDASITGLAVKDWVKALNHHIVHANENYALENVDYTLAK